jgi:hypothetical protein
MTLLHIMLLVIAAIVACWLYTITSRLIQGIVDTALNGWGHAVETLSADKKSRKSRVIKRFCLFPVRVDGEWHWLKTIQLRQELASMDDRLSCPSLGVLWWYEDRSVL